MSGGEKGSKPHGVFVPEGFKTRIEALTSLIRFGPALLPNPEFLALLFHAERTLTYGKKSDAASYLQMTQGVRCKDGEWIRGGCGLAKSRATAANAALERLGLLKRRQRDSMRRGHQATEYEIQWGRFAGLLKKQGCGDTLVRNADKPLSSIRTHRGDYTEGFHHQRGKKQRPETFVEGSTAGATPKKTPKPKTNSLKADDEKNSFPPESPEARLKAWATNRGDPLSLKDWWDIKAQAETRGLDLVQLADLAERNNGHWNSSGAGLRWLVKQFARKSTEAPEEVPTPQPIEKCPKCKCPKGQGALLVDGRIEPCACATPEWRERIGQAAARDAAKGSTIQPAAQVLESLAVTEVA